MPSWARLTPSASRWPRCWATRGYYRRFGFELSTAYQITPPQPEWQPHFQVRVLSGYQPRLRGTFTYPEPFDRT
jgi:predicted N-acetyltransferase YhbS